MIYVFAIVIFFLRTSSNFKIGPEPCDIVSNLEDWEREQTTPTHKRQNLKTSFACLRERNQTHRRRERQGQHEHRSETDKKGSENYGG